MSTRGSIVASAYISMHSRWAQLSLLHPRPLFFFLLLVTVIGLPLKLARRRRLVILTHFQLWILSHVWPFHRESPRRTCISRSRTCIWLVFLMCMQAHAVTCSWLTVAKFFLFSQRISCPLSLCPLLVRDKFFFAEHLPPVLRVYTWMTREFAVFWYLINDSSVRKIHSGER